MAELEFSSKHSAPGDDYFRQQAESSKSTAVATVNTNDLDSESARAEHKKMLEWFFYEKDKQAANRLEMAMDADFYDNMQWDPADADLLRERGQMPLVFNEVAPMCDWLIGTERRTRVDWKVLPRNEDAVEDADTKTKVLKYVSDVNRAPFVRSRAFNDTVKVGIGWVDDGVRDDPTQEIIYSKYEDWRCVLHDSLSYEYDLSDARYIFRWRWVDEDIALLMFPKRTDVIRSAVEEATHRGTTDGAEEDTWFSDQNLQSSETVGAIYNSGTLRASGVGLFADAKRRRVKVIECQYRKPVKTQVVYDGPHKGAILNRDDKVLMDAIAQNRSMVVDKIMMRVHIAVFTESKMLGMAPSPFRHNRYTLTPIFCYRRGRDRLPYGVIRRVRDIQQDLNKRASKALFMLNTNQIIADEGAVDDWNIARDEADKPDGVIIKKQGKEFTIRRDTDGATGQIQMMALDSQNIQKSVGVADENLGRQTNAISGEAIKARQLQGSVVTTEPFDNLRFAVQVQGEKQLSIAEQWMTEEKVIRLTGAKGGIKWLKINTPELQVDGSVKFLNDITANMADFVVSEQDYSGTLRQVMFDSLNGIAGRLPPDIALKMLTIAMEFSDLPNKDQIAEQFRQITGDRDPDKELTQEEQQQAEQQAAQQAEALEMQRQTAIAALQEQQAKVREINARAAKLESESTAGETGENGAGMHEAVMRIQQEASDEIDRVTEDLRRVQSELTNRTLLINKEADTKLEAARIDADARIQIAETQDKSDKIIAAMERRLEDIARTAQDAHKKANEAATKAEVTQPIESKAQPSAQPQPVTVNVQIDATKGGVKKQIKVEHDKDGNITGAQVTEEEGKAE